MSTLLQTAGLAMILHITLFKGCAFLPAIPHLRYLHLRVIDLRSPLHPKHVLLYS